MSLKKFLVFTMVVSLVIGIAGGIGLSKTVKLRYTTLFGGGEGYIMSNLVKQFNQEHPNIKVNEQPIEWAQYYNKLATSIAAGNPPDIAVMHLSVLPDYALRGVLTPIDAYIPSEVENDYLENIIASAELNGQIYAMPIDSHPIVLYYNKAVLREAGLVNSSGKVLVPETLGELYDYAKTVKEKTGKKGVVLENGPMLGERWWMAIYSQLGGKFFDESGNFGLQREKVKQTYETLLRFFKDGVAPSDLNYDDANSLFNADKAAFLVNGVWYMAVAPEIEGLEFGVTLLPPLAGKNPYTWADSHSLVFPKGPNSTKERLEAATTFGQWIVDHTYEWAKAGHIPVIKSVRNSEKFLRLPMRENYMDAAKYAVLAPSIKGWVQIREQLFWEIGTAVVQGAMSPEQATEKLLSGIKDILAGV